MLLRCDRLCMYVGGDGETESPKASSRRCAHRGDHRRRSMKDVFVDDVPAKRDGTDEPRSPTPCNNRVMRCGATSKRAKSQARDTIDDSEARHLARNTALHGEACPLYGVETTNVLAIHRAYRILYSTKRKGQVLVADC